MADEEKQGEVVIGVDVDTKGFDKGTIDVEKAIKSLETTLTKSIENMSKSVSGIFGKQNTKYSAMLTLENNVQKAENKVAGLNRKLEELKNKKIPTEEYKEISKLIQQSEKDLDKLIEKSIAMQETGKQGGKTWEENKAKFEEVRRVFDDAKIELNKLIENGKAFTLGTDTSQYQQLSERLKVAQNELEIAKTKLEEFNTASEMSVLSQKLANIANEAARIDFQPLDLSQYGESARQYAANVNKATLEYEKQANQLRQLQSQLEYLKKQEQTPEVQSKITELESKIQELIVKLQQLGINAQNAQNALNEAVKPEGIISYLKKLEMFSPTSKKIASAVAKIAKGFGKVSKNIATAVSKLNLFNKGQKNAEQLAKKFTKQFTRIFTMLKGRIVRTLVSSIFSGITEGIQQLAKVDSNFNKRISELKSKFTQLKFSVMSAFAPLISFVAPRITEVMNLITSLTDKAGQLMAALTGQTTYQKANYNFEDYAKSLDESNDSTKKLSESTKELNKQLAAFDELNVLNSDGDIDTENTLDSALNPIYTEVPISFSTSDLSLKIKQAFAQGDFTGIGEELGEKLNAEIAKIDSTAIGERIARIINSASSFETGFLTTVEWGELTSKITSNLNTLIDDVDTEQLGEAFAAVLNTVFEIGFTFADEFDWIEFGEKLADFVNGIFEHTDWGKVGETINKFLIGLLDTMLSFLHNLDDDGIEDGVSEFVGRIDIEGIAVRLAKVIWGILKLTWKFLKGFWQGTDIYSFWEKQGEKWGQSLAEKFRDSGLRKLFNDYKETCGDIIAFFVHFFTGDFKSAWKDFNNLIIDVLNIMIGRVEVMLKSLIGNALPTLLEGFSSLIISAINKMIGPLGEIADALFGFSIQPISDKLSSDLRNIDFSLPRIPRFATGTVVPANYGEFAAILGDNKREPEVVSPISTMKQAVIEAMEEYGLLNSGRDGGDIVIQIDGREVFRAVKRENDAQKRRHGGRSQLA